MSRELEWIELYGWYDDEPDVIEFINQEKEFIEQFSEMEGVSLKKAVEAIFPTLTGK